MDPLPLSFQGLSKLGSVTTSKYDKRPDIYIYQQIICLTPAGTQIYCGFKVHDLIMCNLKVQVVVSSGS